MRASKDVIYPGQQTAVVLYSEEFAQKRRAVAQKFMNAYIRAVRDYNDAIQGRQARRAQRGRDHLDPHRIHQHQGSRDLSRHERRSPSNPNGHVNAATLKNDFDFFHERGLIERQGDGGPGDRPSFADEAVRTARALQAAIEWHAGRSMRACGARGLGDRMITHEQNEYLCRGPAPARRWASCSAATGFRPDGGGTAAAELPAGAGAIARRAADRVPRHARAASA